ncbi:MAG: hypothetical protein AAGG48_21575 [Planctomycetota bacterium]
MLGILRLPKEADSARSRNRDGHVIEMATQQPTHATVGGAIGDYFRSGELSG